MSLIYLPKSFKVLFFTLRSLIHLEFTVSTVEGIFFSHGFIQFIE